MSFKEAGDQLERARAEITAIAEAAAEAARQAAIASERALEAAQEAVKACRAEEEIAGKSSSLLDKELGK